MWPMHHRWLQTTLAFIGNCLLYQWEIFMGENFCKLVKNTIFAEKMSLIARFCCAKGCYAPKFHGKTFWNSHKTAQFAELESFPLYTLYFVLQHVYVYRMLTVVLWDFISSELLLTFVVLWKKWIRAVRGPALSLRIMIPQRIPKRRKL